MTDTGWTERKDILRAQYKFFSDAGHGWVEVPDAIIQELGIASAITSYSYRKGDLWYLEEDQDAQTFVDALNARGITPQWLEYNHGGHSPIRNYNRVQRA